MSESGGSYNTHKGFIGDTHIYINTLGKAEHTYQQGTHSEKAQGGGHTRVVDGLNRAVSYLQGKSRAGLAGRECGPGGARAGGSGVSRRAHTGPASISPQGGLTN
ncbi:Formin-like protein 1 [Frankliniella fusca]|uniref:Formin-like protein 1 n=1 Tax=Frankliniella fusca TaxID=407009 RepID=A0AAE1HG38_9NEOP|nr:Formin-like protein 1 [Frankliniella fusca]